MRSFFLVTVFTIGAFASPAKHEEKVLEAKTFCNGAKASMAKESKAATAYCSAYLNVPVVTIKKTVSCVTKTVTQTTSTKTYLWYPETTRVAKTITLPSRVSGTVTKTITTSVSTETYTNPLAACPVARQGCQKKRDASPPSLFESRPACLSSYSAWSVSKACRCLSISTSTTTKHITQAGAPTSTITIQAAGKKTRTLTRTITTGTVTITPTYGATTTTKIAATETVILYGPFKIASGPDYRLNPAHGWAYADGNMNQDVAAEFGGDSDCKSSYFALNGTQLVTQYYDGSTSFPGYNLIGNAKVTSGQGANPVYFTSKSQMTSERKPLSCTFSASTDEANVNAACPLTCTYPGGSSRNTERGSDGAWYIGDGDEEEESFTMYAYQYGGPST